MKFKPYVDTHIHTCYSLLDGVSSPEENVKRAVELGSPGLAISDHGTVAGIFEFYNAAKKAGLVPLCGNELYFKETLQDGNKERKYYHGVFLAMNNTGFKNLMWLSSVGFKPGHFEFRRPVVSIEEIAAHSEGLVYSTGCMLGALGTAQRNQLSLAEAETLLQKMHDIFKGRMFIEIGPAQVCSDWEKGPEGKFQFEPREEKEIIVGENTFWTNCLQMEQNHRAMYFAKKFNVPLVVASDGHMTHPEMKPTQDMLMTSAIGNSNGFHLDQIHSMLGSEETWVELQKNHSYFEQKMYEECIDNTYQVLDMCRGLDLNFAPMVPQFPLEKHPLYTAGMTPRHLMLSIIKANGRMPAGDVRYAARLKEELSVICDNGLTDYTDYFLILADIARAAKDRNVGMGPARGSAGGCLLSYLLGITALDPIKWNLNFVRFLNEGRLGTPKISFPEYSFETFLKENKV